jgi:hypothetical protein
MTIPQSLPSHWPTGFPLQVLPIYFLFLLIIIPTLGTMLQGCVDPQIPRDGQTFPKSSTCTCHHHLNVAQESL